MPFSLLKPALASWMFSYCHDLTFTDRFEGTKLGLYMLPNPKKLRLRGSPNHSTDPDTNHRLLNQVLIAGVFINVQPITRGLSENSQLPFFSAPFYCLTQGFILSAVSDALSMMAYQVYFMTHHSWNLISRTETEVKYSQ